MIRTGAIAAGVKFLGAGLTYLMFVAVAKVTDASGFGAFGTMFSVASLISFIAPIGQQSAVLRFFPEWKAKGELALANGHLIRSMWTALAGSLVFAAAMALFILCGGQRELLPYALSGAALAFALSFAEFLAGGMRSRGALLFSLLPRDVVWRGLFIAGVIAAALAGHRAIDVNLLLWAGALLLLLAILPQWLSIMRAVRREGVVNLDDGQRTTFRQVTMGLWGITSLPPAAGQASTVIVAALVGLEAAGGMFAAERTARLVVLALTGLNQVFAPNISAGFHSGRLVDVQTMVRRIAILGAGAAAICVTLFVLLGRHVMGVFDPAYATWEIYVALNVFGFGQLLAAAAGPVSLLLQVTGQQGGFFKILMACNIVGLVATWFGAARFGATGAAIAISVTLVCWSWWGVAYARSRIGIDPSLFGNSRLRKV